MIRLFSHKQRLGFAFCGFVLFFLGISGCGSRVPREARVSSVIIVVVDRSLPGSMQREAQLSLLDSLAKSAAEAHCKFELWSYDAAETKLTGPSFLDSVDDIDSIENKQLMHTLPGAQRVARPDLALDAVAQEIESRKFSGGRVVVLTDGYLMDSGAVTLLTGAGKPFIPLEGWRLSVLGVVPEYRGQWSEALSPDFGTRLDLVDGAAASKLLRENRDE